MFPQIAHYLDHICFNSVSSKKAAASVPIMEYVLHVVHFIDAILSTNSTDDHIREFMQQGGYSPLLDLAIMLSLPLDFATSNACSAIATACKGILVSSEIYSNIWLVH